MNQTSEELKWRHRKYSPVLQWLIFAILMLSIIDGLTTSFVIPAGSMSLGNCLLVFVAAVYLHLREPGRTASLILGASLWQVVQVPVIFAMAASYSDLDLGRLLTFSLFNGVLLAALAIWGFVVPRRAQMISALAVLPLPFFLYCFYSALAWFMSDAFNLHFMIRSAAANLSEPVFCVVSIVGSIGGVIYWAGFLLIAPRKLLLWRRVK